MTETDTLEEQRHGMMLAQGVPTLQNINRDEAGDRDVGRGFMLQMLKCTVMKMTFFYFLYFLYYRKWCWCRPWQKVLEMSLTH